MRHLILRLEAPLMSCGGETIDNYGVIRSFPAASMLTGLLGNALGWRRVEGERHQGLQDRLVYAVRIDREPAGTSWLQDYQTARLTSTKHWTTRGEPEGRAGGGGASFTHLRFRDYLTDMHFTVAVRMDSPDHTPTVDDLADALEWPFRPLFIGRKPCLPSGPIFHGFSEGDTALTALLGVPLAEPGDGKDNVRLMWPENDSPREGTEVVHSRSYMLTDERNWVSGLHGGGRMVCEGSIERVRLPGRDAATALVGEEGRQ